jgi:hypothetical protein
MESGVHAALQDTPEDTDVLHVLTRVPRIPETVVSAAFVFRIATDGRIAVVGRTADAAGQ